MGQRLHHLLGGADGPFRVILLCHGGAENGHEAVSDVLVEGTVVLEKDVRPA